MGFLHNIAQAMRRLDGLVIESKDTMQIIKQELIESQKKSISKTDRVQELVDSVKESFREKIEKYTSFINNHLIASLTNKMKWDNKSNSSKLCKSILVFLNSGQNSILLAVSTIKK